MDKIKHGWDDFKKFALRGNVLDLAVGVIIGGAFGKIVSSLVSDIVMPLIGLLLGTTNFKDLQLTLRPEIVQTATDKIPALVLNYGNFIQTVVDFLIISLSIYLFVKLIEGVRRKLEPPKPVESAVVEPPRSEALLEQILDELKKQNQK